MVKTRKRKMINGGDYPLDSDVFRHERKNINKAIRQTERNSHKPIISLKDLNHLTDF
jgi:hypothetical protein